MAYEYVKSLDVTRGYLSNNKLAYCPGHSFWYVTSDRLASGLVRLSLVCLISDKSELSYSIGVSRVALIYN